MAYIVLAVAEAVLEHVAKKGPNNRQIAIRELSPDLLPAIGAARRNKKVGVLMNGAIELSVGDPAAIWATHQSPGNQIKDFECFYDLLARRPGRSVTFHVT